MRRGAMTTGLLGSGLTILILLSVLFLPRYLVERESGSIARLTSAELVKAVNDVRATLLQGIGGLVLLVGAIVSIRQLQGNRDANVTDFFSRAIDQMGSDDLNIRLGGIHALSRIARNSADDREAIAEILTTFLRNRCPWPPESSSPYSRDFPLSDLPPLRIRAPDAQAALSALGRGLANAYPTTRARGKGANRFRVDLDHTDLRKALLREPANLIPIRLSESCLDGSVFVGVDLYGAWIQNTSIREASFVNISTRLRKATLIKVDLTGARFFGADFGSTFLDNVQLGKAEFHGCYLRWARVRASNFTGAKADAETILPKNFDLSQAGVSVQGGSRNPRTLANIWAWYRFTLNYKPMRVGGRVKHIF